MDNPTGVNSEEGDPPDETPPRRDMAIVELVALPFFAVWVLPVVLVGVVVRPFGDEALEWYIDAALRPFLALMWLALRPFGYAKTDVCGP